ncbi:1,2-phenylacetyl-CoA epoxidase subunit PaaE [Pseudotenacibaculum haliotis]|uniref:1,2-phenylacetyl-CoA epoxidase subunit PaaE n=1 Tax=Pseudotenacibaculum haliotis TaxID=1862138 RepID=A0ABW5LU99_9FLAO
MTDFHQVKIKDIYKETKDTVAVSFDIPEYLHDNFKFKQGQHLTVKKTINGEDIRRSYSLCTSPLEREWKVAIKQIPGGIFSTYANNELKIGDEIEIMEPSGNFFVEVDPTTPKNYIAFAAGSGITPMLSIIKTHLESEPDATFKLFYLNRTTKSIIFKEEIEQLKNIYFERFHVFYFLTKEQRDIAFLNGRFDKEKIETLTKTFIDVPDTAHCFICGPQEMIFLIRDELEAAGLDKSKIHYELFFSGDSEASNKHIAELLEQKAEGTEVTIVDGGKEFHFTMDDDFDNILDGALAAGADLPFACKGGVCSTCKCKVVEGNVEMKINYALEEDEVAQNFVLSCQAVPTTEKVVVDFDV